MLRIETGTFHELKGRGACGVNKILNWTFSFSWATCRPLCWLGWKCHIGGSHRTYRNPLTSWTMQCSSGYCCSCRRILVVSAVAEEVDPASPSSLWNPVCGATGSGGCLYWQLRWQRFLGPYWPAWTQRARRQWMSTFRTHMSHLKAKHSLA